MSLWLPGVAGALAGVEPEVMGLGPIAATKKVMAKTGLTVDDMDLIEANEGLLPLSLLPSVRLCTSTRAS